MLTNKFAFLLILFVSILVYYLFWIGKTESSFSFSSFQEKNLLDGEEVNQNIFQRRLLGELDFDTLIKNHYKYHNQITKKNFEGRKKKKKKKANQSEEKKKLKKN